MNPLIKNLLLIVGTCLFASFSSFGDVQKLTGEDSDSSRILKGCFERAGNPITQSEYRKSLRGDRVLVIGEVREILETPDPKTSQVRFGRTLDGWQNQKTGENTILNNVDFIGNLPDEQIAKLRTNEWYEFEATITQVEYREDRYSCTLIDVYVHGLIWR